MRKFIALTLTGAALAVGGVAAAQPAPQPDARAAEVTREQVQARAAQAFARMDLNKDGKLDQGDRQARRQAAFERIDADHNGAISLAEFSAVREQRREGPQARGDRRPGRPLAAAQRGLRLGAAADADRDGAVTQAEFAAATVARFDRADANKDGKLTRDERRGGMRGMLGRAPRRNAG